MNFTALSNAPNKEAINNYIAMHPEQKQFMHIGGEYIPRKSKSKWIATWTPISIIVIIIVYLSIVARASAENQTSVMTGISIAVVVIIMIVIMVSLILLGSDMKKNNWRIAAQLDQFARDNNFIHVRDQVVGPLGMMTAYDKDVAYLKTNAIVTPDFEVGKIYAQDYSNNKGSREFGYIKIKLATKLPNMLLAAKVKTDLPNILGDSSSAYRDNDKVELEGDFNKYFTLVVPKGYQEMARYFFTPDVMALFIDNDHGNDVEIIDDALYVYPAMNWFTPTFWENAQKIHDTIGVKMEEQAEQYKVASELSSRLAIPDPTTVKPGSRLKRSTPIAIVILTGFIIVGQGFRIYNTLVNPTSDSSTSSAQSTPAPELAPTKTDVDTAKLVAQSWIRAVKNDNYTNALSFEDQSVATKSNKEEQKNTFSTFVDPDREFTQKDIATGIRAEDQKAIVSVVYATDDVTSTSPYLRFELWRASSTWKIWGIYHNYGELKADIEAKP